MSEKSVRGRPSRKEEILTAAERLIAEQGVGGVTTRAIAQAVPCSEGAIYVHFEDRLDLILAVLYRTMPEMLVPLQGLDAQVGSASPQKNLERAVRGLLQFHERAIPLLCSMLGDTELLGRFQLSMREAGKGPDRGIATLANYITQEQRSGRIHAEVEASIAARMLMAGSFFHAFTSRFLGTEAKLNVKALVSAALRSELRES